MGFVLGYLLDGLLLHELGSFCDAVINLRLLRSSRRCQREVLYSEILFLANCCVKILNDLFDLY